MTKQKHFFLFRGLIRESKHWGDFPELISQAFPTASITMIDIPGAGIHFRSPSPISIKKMVEVMRRTYLEKRQENEECILLAISLGGMIAGQWLKDYPEDFQKSILVNTSYGGISKPFDRLKPSALAYLFKVPVLKGRAKEAHILRLVSNHKNVFDKTLDLWETIQKERPVSLSNTIRQITAGGLFRIGNFKPRTPILILASINDRMVSVNCSRALAEKWGAKIEEHPTAGHDLSADDPKWMVEKIKEFSA
jgi:pimeloyl-[acyl-carrier protein] methyl ester esterase